MGSASKFYNDVHSECEASEEMATANIIVAGITGSGKSTLINAVFGKRLAKTGFGAPITQKIEEYHVQDHPIHIWDTVGLELDKDTTEKSLRNIRKVIAEKGQSAGMFDQIHAIWYCINSNCNRYQPAELALIKELHSLGVPFIIVLTQCKDDPAQINQFSAVIQEENKRAGLSDISIIQVCAQDFPMRGITIPAFGLNDLVHMTMDMLPKFIKSGFAAAQRVDKEIKRLGCEDIIYDCVQSAKEGFWAKAPIANIFSADRRIRGMLKKISITYNTVLASDAIKKLMDDCHIDFKNIWNGLLTPLGRKYKIKVDQTLERCKQNGFKVNMDTKFDHSERVARMVAFYGYIFVEAIEELWDKTTEEQLQNADQVIKELVIIINRKLNELQK